MKDDLNLRDQADNPRVWVPALREAGIAFLTAAVVLGIVYSVFFRSIHPDFVPFMDRSAATLVAPGKDLIPISVGGYRVDGHSAVIENFNGDEAILALARAFEAEDYPFIKVNLKGFTRYSKFKILWRQADNPSKTHALEFNRSGDGATQIAMVFGGESYRGSIADLALLFYDGPALGISNNNDTDITVDSLELRPFSAWQVAEQVYEDWTNPPLLQGYSNNVVLGIHNHGLLYPNAVANLLVLTGMLLVLSHRAIQMQRSGAAAHSSALATALSLCLYGWIFNDALRWQWRIEQLLDSHERYAGLVLEERIINNDIRCARFPENCKAELLPYF